MQRTSSKSSNNLLDSKTDEPSELTSLVKNNRFQRGKWNLEALQYTLGRRDFPIKLGEYPQDSKAISMWKQIQSLFFSADLIKTILGIHSTGGTTISHLLKRKLLSLKCPDYCRLRIKDSMLILSSEIYTLEFAIKNYNQNGNNLYLLSLNLETVKVGSQRHEALWHLNHESVKEHVKRVALEDIEPLLVENAQMKTSNKKCFEDYYLCYLDYLVRASYSKQILSILEAQMEKGTKGVEEVNLHKDDDFERLSVRIRCILEMQKWLVAAQNGEQSDSMAIENEEISVHFEYKMFGKDNFMKFMELVDNTDKQSKAVLKYKKMRLLEGSRVCLSEYQRLRREEIIREYERDLRRFSNESKIADQQFPQMQQMQLQQQLQSMRLWDEEQQIQFKESGGVRVFRSEYDIIDVWSNVQFVEFETKKNIDQQMDNTSRFLPFLRLGEIDHDLCNSHLFCVLPSNSNANLNQQSQEADQYLQPLEPVLPKAPEVHQRHHLYPLAPHILFNASSLLKRLQEYQTSQYIYNLFSLPSAQLSSQQQDFSLSQQQPQPNKIQQNQQQQQQQPNSYTHQSAPFQHQNPSIQQQFSQQSMTFSRQQFLPFNSTFGSNSLYPEEDSASPDKNQLILFLKFSTSQISAALPSALVSQRTSLQNSHYRSQLLLKNFILNVYPKKLKGCCRSPFIICMRMSQSDTFSKKYSASLINYILPNEYLLLIPIIKRNALVFQVNISHNKIQSQLDFEDHAQLMSILKENSPNSRIELLSFLNSILLSCIAKNVLLKTPFKLEKFNRVRQKRFESRLVKSNAPSYLITMRLASSIKVTKSKKDFYLDLVIDPEQPFEVRFENVQVCESDEPPFSAHLTEFSKDLSETMPETWVLLMCELFIQTALDFIHDRVQMMQTDETHYYRHELSKLMNFDESNLKNFPQLDSSIKTKYLGINFNYIEVARQKSTKRQSSIQPHIQYQMQMQSRVNSGNPYSQQQLQFQHGQPPNNGIVMVPSNNTNNPPIQQYPPENIKSLRMNSIQPQNPQHLGVNPITQQSQYQPQQQVSPSPLPQAPQVQSYYNMPGGVVPYQQTRQQSTQQQYPNLQQQAPEYQQHMIPMARQNSSASLERSVLGLMPSVSAPGVFAPGNIIPQKHQNMIPMSQQPPVMPVQGQDLSSSQMQRSYSVYSGAPTFNGGAPMQMPSISSMNSQGPPPLLLQQEPNSGNIQSIPYDANNLQMPYNGNMEMPISGSQYPITPKHF